VELDALAGELGLAAIRFDYSGHGASGGAFREGTISRWLEEAIAVLDDIKPKRGVILVGSSMGGWIALRLVQELKTRKKAAKVDGIVLIAPAPDFTAELIEPNLTEAERHLACRARLSRGAVRIQPGAQCLYPRADRGRPQQSRHERALSRRAARSTSCRA
jgi:pimeloyl-ACP methyl ester carboxylesterase